MVALKAVLGLFSLRESDHSGSCVLFHHSKYSIKASYDLMRIWAEPYSFFFFLLSQCHCPVHNSVQLRLFLLKICLNCPWSCETLMCVCVCVDIWKPLILSVWMWKKSEVFHRLSHLSSYYMMLKNIIKSQKKNLLLTCLHKHSPISCSVPSAHIQVQTQIRHVPVWTVLLCELFISLYTLAKMSSRCFSGSKSFWFVISTTLICRH